MVRGQDLFWSTSVHRLLQALLGLPAPLYHHHRLILDADGRKLSKSTPATGLRELRAQGVDARPISAGWSGSPCSRSFRACHASAGPGILDGETQAQAGEAARIRDKSAASAPRRAAVARRRAVEIALAGLAHDIRTPLTGILALAELLNASDLPERERAGRRRSRARAEHLARLTTLVVDAAKAEATGLVAAQEPFSPRELADSVAAALAARAEDKALKAEIAIASDLPALVAGDAVRLRSALENLIDNAVKFTERGSVAFTVERRARPGAAGCG